MIIKNCFSGLFEKNENGELMSSFVESYDVSESGNRYVFHLYKDKNWSIYRDRKVETYAPVTAQDFAFAIKRVFSNNPDCDAMRVLSDIKNADKALEGDFSKFGVYCPDDYTLIIDLENKNTSLLEVFTSSELFPCNQEFFDSTSGRYGLSGELLIFNGAFVISAWGESSVKLTKNPNSPFEVTAAGVTLYQPKATREEVKLLKEGDIDAAFLSADKMDALSSSGVDTKRNTSVIWVMVFNQSEGVWANQNLRNAVLHCTDRSVIKGGEHISSCDRIVSSTAALFSKNYQNQTKDVAAPKFLSEKAKEYFEAAKAETEGESFLNMPILIPDSPLYKDSFSALNQVYQRELSLYFSPEYLSSADIVSRVKKGDFSAALIPLSVSNDNPDVMLEHFNSASPICIKAADTKKFTKYFLEARKYSTAEECIPLYAKAEKALYKAAEVNPLFSESSYFVSSKAVSGFVTDSSGTVLFKAVKKK